MCEASDIDLNYLLFKPVYFEYILYNHKYQLCMLQTLKVYSRFQDYNMRRIVSETTVFVYYWISIFHIQLDDIGVSQFANSLVMSLIFYTTP